MRLYGYFNQAPTPAAYISAVVSIPDLNVKATVQFLIDTGATKTVIMEKDVGRLGIDCSRLSNPSRLFGIGGDIEACQMAGVDFIFDEEERGEHTERLETIRIASRNREKPEKFGLPSMLGRDVLNKYRLVYDKRKNSVFITDE